MTDMNAENEIRIHRDPVPASVEHNRTPRKNGNGQPAPAPPQDRSSMDSSVGGISTMSIGSYASKCSTATPNLIFTANPVTSPPFPLISPANHGRARGVGVGVGVGVNQKKSTQTTCSTKKNAPDSYGSKTTTNVKNVLLSPPKIKTAARTAAPMKNVDIQKCPSLEEIRKEIHDLTSQFAKLEQESQQRREIFDLDPRDRFDESLGIMGKKADAMVDVMHRNYIHLSHLSRENKDLKNQIQQMQKIYISNETETEIENENQKKWKENNNLCSRSGGSSSALELLQKIDASDNYVKRSYPPVPKTPGTMFTTELVEVMSLGVGEHAYLAEIMDRQWNTTTDYRPKQNE